MKYTLETTKQYDKWFRKLKDSLIRIKILTRLSRVERGINRGLENKTF
jgi:putative component of toxin-antitoxin plasmid stabilization module